MIALQRRTFRSLARHRNFRLFFAGQVVSLAGTWMQNVALAWLVLELSGSPLAVGALAFARFAPFTAFGLVGGWVVDRVDTRRLVAATQAAAMVVSALLAAATLSGIATLPLVYALATLGGVALVFDAPGRQALTFEMVGPRRLSNAVALNSSLFNAARIVGPALAGVLIGAYGVGVCFVLNALSFLTVLASLVLMRKGELFPVEKDRGQSFAAGIGEGVRYVLAHRELRVVLGVVVVTSTVGFNFHVVLPLLASDTLEAGPAAFGLLSAAFGVGALAGALASATLGRASRRVFLAGAAGFSLALAALATVHSPWPAALLLFAVGVSFTLFTSNANALVQLGAPDRLRGRIVSLYLFAFAGLAPIGGLLAGWLASLGGTPLAFTVAGAAGLAAVAAAARTLRPAA